MKLRLLSTKLTNDDTGLVNTQYNGDIEDEEKAKNKVDLSVNYDYTLKLDKVKHSQFMSPPPYITSSIQQDASNKLGMSPKVTMQNLQKLYEAGKITYMRTDSIAISKEFIKTCKKAI